MAALFFRLSADKRRVAHQHHTMGSERRPNQCKYWNLRPVVMPECSLIATRNSHAKHNKSVGRIPDFLFFGGPKPPWLSQRGPQAGSRTTWVSSRHNIVPPIHKLYSFLGGEKFNNYLGYNWLSCTIICLLMVTDPLVSKDSLQWWLRASLHPWANQPQKQNILKFLGT